MLFGRCLGGLSDKRDANIDEFVRAVQDLLKVSERLVFVPPHIAKALAMAIWTQHCDAWDTVLRIGKTLFYNLMNVTHSSTYILSIDD